MHVFDQYLIGDLDNIKFDFNSFHLQERLRENNISQSVIENIVRNEEPEYHIASHDDRFEVFFRAPENKDYEYLKLIIKCESSTICVITLFPDSTVGDNKNRTKFHSKKHKNVKNMVFKAHSQRKRMN